MFLLNWLLAESQAYSFDSTKWILPSERIKRPNGRIARSALMSGLLEQAQELCCVVPDYVLCDDSSLVQPLLGVQ